jgi:hypothetical protein
MIAEPRDGNIRVTLGPAIVGPCRLSYELTLRLTLAAIRST